MRDGETGDSTTEFDSRNARVGLLFFFAYVALYATFVYLSAFRADVMAMKPVAGINVAIWYGLGLIVAAIVLAVIYMFVCKSPRR